MGHQLIVGVMARGRRVRDYAGGFPSAIGQRAILSRVGGSGMFEYAMILPRKGAHINCARSDLQCASCGALAPDVRHELRSHQPLIDMAPPPSVEISSGGRHLKWICSSACPNVISGLPDRSLIERTPVTLIVDSLFTPTFPPVASSNASTVFPPVVMMSPGFRSRRV